MLKRISVGLLLLNFTIGTGPALALPTDAETVKSMQALALESCARCDVETGLKTFRSAIMLAEKTFGKDSSYVSDLYYEAGVAAMKTSNYREAEDLLNKAVSVNPNACEAHLTLAEYYRLHGKLDSAKKEVRQVLDHDPRNIEAQCILAATYQKEGDVGKALEHYGKLQYLATMQPGAETQPSTFTPSTAPTPQSTEANPAGNLNFQRLPQPNAKPATPPPQVNPQESTAPPVTKPAPHTGNLDELLLLNQRHKPAHETHSKAKGKQHPETAAPEEEYTISGSQARLRSKVKLLTKMRRGAAAASSDEEMLPLTARPSAQAATSSARASRHERKQHDSTHNHKLPKTPKGMVPPPPAVPATIPAYMPPPKPVAPAQAAAKGPVFKAAVPKVDTSEEKPAPSPASTSSASSSSSDGDDGDFLLDWAGKKKKKK